MSEQNEQFDETTSLRAESGILAPFEPESLPEANRPVPRVDGRNPDGTFARGNALGVGNPLAGKVAKLRGAMLSVVGTDSIQALISAMLRKAANGDVAAARLVLEYTLGQPEALDLLKIVTTLEASVLRGMA